MTARNGRNALFHARLLRVMDQMSELTQSHGRNEIVSIIITTRNAGLTLERCLRSVKAQSYENTETIVVDNFSQDQTEKIAQRFADKFSEVGPERSSQRNHGAKLASGDFFMFIDADMELTRNVVEDCLLGAAGHDALIIPEKTVGVNYLARIRRIERDACIGSLLFEAARFVRREVFESMGGYDTRLTGLEDYDFQARLEEHGYAIGFSAGEILHHEDGLSLGRHLKKRAYYAKGLRLYESLHPDRARLQFGPRRFLFYVRTMGSRPIALTSVLSLKALEYAAFEGSHLLSSSSARPTAQDIYAPR